MMQCKPSVVSITLTLGLIMVNVKDFSNHAPLESVSRDHFEQMSV